MAMDRDIPLLGDLAFKALLRHSVLITSEIEQEVYLRYHHKHNISKLLQSIADANPAQMKNFLDKCPEFAVVARDNITTASGYTYQNISAIELIYLMDDCELMENLLLYIKKMRQEMIKNAVIQLENKMTEVEKQRTQFKRYNFDKIAKIITADHSLRKTGQPNEIIQKELAELKKDFPLVCIQEGKSWIKEHLQEAFAIHTANWNLWNANQSEWYLIQVIGFLQTLVEKCFEQECCQDLHKIANLKIPNTRSSDLKNNWINSYPMKYRGNDDSSLILGRDFYVAITSACASWPVKGGSGSWDVDTCMKNYFQHKNQQWENIMRKINALVYQPSSPEHSLSR